MLHSRRAFTLVELLVVILIIGALLALTLTVGPKLLGTGKQRFTEDTLKILEQSLNAYVSEKGSIPPAYVEDPRNTTTTSPKRVIPVADARNLTSAGNGTIINSVGLYMLEAKASASATAVLNGLPEKAVRIDFSPDGITSDLTLQPTLRTVVDGWGNPIRYVHPAFKGQINASTTSGGSTSAAVDPEVVVGRARPGTQFAINRIRRNSGATPENDADGGAPKGDRPYFYSAGPDGDPSTTADNVYLTLPTFPK